MEPENVRTALGQHRRGTSQAELPTMSPREENVSLQKKAVFASSASKDVRVLDPSSANDLRQRAKQYSMIQHPTTSVMTPYQKISNASTNELSIGQ